MTLPTKIGRYEIQREIGRGGMAIVYQAHDPMFARDVAVKVLPGTHLGDPNFRLRFEREAKMVAALEHPAVVPVYDFGEENGRLYLVMRLMSGGTLSARLQEGPLPVQEAVTILNRIASALDVAHQKGIVHRDLKPDNILFDQYGSAYLSDFGIARLAESQATLTGHFAIGTPGYMSPEQIQGQTLDGRSDIYALGVIIFEMLTGKRPFQADTPAMVLVKQMTNTSPSVRDFLPDLPETYDAVLQQTMAKRREDRPDTARAIAQQLNEAVNATIISPIEPVAPTMVTPAAAPGTGRQMTPRPMPPVVDAGNDMTIVEPLPVPAVAVAGGGGQRRRWWLWGGGAVLLLLLLGLLFLPREETAVEPTEPAATAVAEVVPTEVVEEEVVAVEETAVVDDHTIDDHLTAGFAAIDSGDYELALSEADQALGHEENNQEALMLRGRSLHTLGRFEEAAATFSQVIELYPDDLPAYLELGYIQSAYFGDGDSALANYNRAIEIDPDSEWALNNRCQLYYNRGNLDEAKADCDRCLELNGENRQCLIARGIVARDQGEPELALDFFAQALALDDQDAYTHVKVAEVHLWGLGDAQTALNALDTAIGIEPNDPYFFYLRGTASRYLDDVDAAIADYTHYLENSTNDYCPDCDNEARRYLEDRQPIEPGRRTNFAFRQTATAEASVDGYPPEYVLDGDIWSSWFAQDGSPQEIEIDLGEPRNLVAIELRVEQAESGDTVHEIWGKGPDDTDYTLLHTFAEYTESQYWLFYEQDEAWSGLQYVLIRTTQSPSPAAWFEVRLIGYGE